MAKDRMDVLELLRKEASDADLDFLREGRSCAGHGLLKVVIGRRWRAP